jgi:glutathione S-transferase
VPSVTQYVVPRMKLYGTTTSPFVRRVRVVAQEIGVPIELVNTAPDEGQAALRAVSPIRKVPVMVLAEGKTLFDSRAIIDWLKTNRGWGGLAAAPDAWRELDLLNAIDGALDSIIQLFYLRRDGVAIDGTPYAIRQLERAAAIFAWLGTQLAPHQLGFTGSKQLGLVEISLICALDWMDFRQTYDTASLTALQPLRSHFRERASLVATRPQA